MEKKKFYLTTAIAYTSAVPHIGNVYEAILADSIVRYKRLEGYDTFFQTGTDEHGQKIQLKAEEKGITPKEYVDNISNEIRRIYDSVGVSYDKFIRTTDKDHELQVQKIFEYLYKKGDIYKGAYEGLYCVPCESFFTESQLVDGKCPDCGREVSKAKEEAYFLKLDTYQDKLVKYIKDHPNFIQPESRKNEMLNNFLKDKLPDLCVSRTSFNWGIPVIFDKKHVTYVWIDALSNYITGLGYDVDGNWSYNFKKYWPADVHLIGKDILRFHTIYWPIMLMALDIELPKQVFGHPWILVGKDKMSKSRGNIMYTDDLIKFFGVDAVRYYVLHEMPFAQDGTITYELLIERINADLVNNLGNLVNRTVAMGVKYFKGDIKNTKVNEEIDNELVNLANETKELVSKSMDELKVCDAMEYIFKLLRRANKYVDETEPWILGRDEAKYDRLNTVLYNLLETIRYSAVLLSSFIPNTSKKIFEILKTDLTSLDSLEFGKYELKEPLVQAQPLFNRIDANEKMKEINEYFEEKKAEAVLEPKKELITIDDFDKVELKVGKVLSCKKHEKADKLLVSQVDLGNEVRQIVSGIAKYYSPEEMVGKNVIVVTNLKPVVLRGVESFGMILCGEDENGLKVLCADGLKPGSEIR